MRDREKAGGRQEGWTSPGFGAPKRRDYGSPPIAETWSGRGRCDVKENNKDRGNPGHKGIWIRLPSWPRHSN